MSSRTFTQCMLVFAVALAACGTQTPASAAPADCPVTRPPNPAFTPPDTHPSAPPSAGTFWYGSPELWTALPDDGVWSGLAHSDPDAAQHWSQKVFFWSAGYDAGLEPEPALSLQAALLSDPAEVSHTAAASNAYHPDLGPAMLTGIDLPSSGCWQLTASYQGRELAFVVWVAPE